MIITSVQNAKVKAWCKLHEKKHRENQQKFLVENEHLIQEAFQAGLLEELILLEGFDMNLNFDKERIIVTEAVMNKLKTNPSMPKCMGVVRMPKVQANLGNKILLCDDVQDPGNLGTMIRSAYSFGFDSFITSRGSADLYNEKVIRSTQGALFHMNVIRGNLMDFIHKFKQSGYKIYGTALENGKGLSTFANEEKVVLIFGNEGSGIKEDILKECDDRIYIEMSRFESLNVAMACTVCTYWFRKE